MCKGSAYFDSPGYWMSAIFLQNCEKPCRIIGLNREKRNKLCPRSVRQKRTPHSTVYLRRKEKSIFKRLTYTPPNLSPRFTCKVNLSNTKNPACLLFLTFLLDRGKQRVNWLPPRTSVCFTKLCFGAVPLSIVSPTEWLERLWTNLIKLRWWTTGLFCLGIICFPSLINYDQAWLLFLSVHIRLLARCKNFFHSRTVKLFFF